MATENIPSRLHSVAQGNVVTGANEILDDTKAKKQSVINQENDQRLETLETAVGTGGSVDSRIESAKTEIVGGASSDCNTLGKAEALISTNASDIAALQEAYAGLTQNDVVVVAPADTWPVASPAQNIIYRVVDRTNTPPQYYTDYMWNGTAMVEMAQYNNAIDAVPTAGSHNLVESGGVQNELALGAVYDVTAHNSNATFDSLEALLSDANLNTLIPTSVRKGGMSIKFVQSSDNKYVQYRLMSDTFNTTPANWQGVDDEPTVGSQNLMKSGGVFNNYDQIKVNLNSQLSTKLDMVDGYYIVTAGDIDSQINITPQVSPVFRCAVIECQEGDIFYISGQGGSTPRLYCFVDNDNYILQVAPSITRWETPTKVVAPLNAKKLILNDNNSYLNSYSGETALNRVLKPICDLVYSHDVLDELLDLSDTSVWERGNINIEDGQNINSSKRIRTTGSISHFNLIQAKIDSTAIIKIIVYAYHDDDYLGYVTSFDTHITEEIISTVYSTANKYRICLYDDKTGASDIGTIENYFSTVVAVSGTADTYKTVPPAFVERDELKYGNVLYGKKWVACGDSFTHGDFTNSLTDDYIIEEGIYKGQYKVYPYLIGNRNNMQIINEALNGSHMGYIASRPNLSFSYQRYMNIPADADYITLKFGINDDNQQIPIGTISDTVDTTFMGAWNKVLAYIIEHHLQAKIGIIITNGARIEYANATIAIAEKWGIPYLNEATDDQVSFMYYSNRTDVMQSVRDMRNRYWAVNLDMSNRHPNEKAQEFESTVIENWLRSL